MKHLLTPSLLMLALLGLAAAPAASQCSLPGQAIPNATLRVALWFDNGHPVDERLRVELTTAFGDYTSDTYSDSQGQAIFGSVRPGRYRLRVSGHNAEETTTDIFSIGCGGGQHLENVEVRYRNEDGKDPESAAPGGTVAAVDLNVPDKAKKEFERGTAALNLNNLAEAKKCFEKAVQAYPRYASAYNNLGIVAMKMGETEAARDAFEKAVHINDHYPRACVNLARMDITDGQYDDAEGLLNRALSTEPLNLEALTLLANLQLETGRYDQAINTAWKVHSVPHEGYSVVHIVAAMALQSRHMPAEAAVEYQTYLKESPHGPEAPRALAALAVIQGKGP